ncbi:MAG: hypothetical protein OXE50_15895 [Chloroflexi bacterium]|nr:hypothetical protein [Chloroflexota bacterium]
MAYALTPNEIIEVRNAVDTTLTDVQLNDAIITNQSNLGSASDYVMDRLREKIVVSKLTSDQLAAYTDALTNSESAITSFINVVLSPPQDIQFKRAVVLRTAGNVAGSYTQVVGGGGIGVSENRDVADRFDIQDDLYRRSDEQIQLIFDAYPDDAFTPEQRRAKYKLFTLTEGY